MLQSHSVMHTTGKASMSLVSVLPLALLLVVVIERLNHRIGDVDAGWTPDRHGAQAHAAHLAADIRKCVRISTLFLVFFLGRLAKTEDHADAVGLGVCLAGSDDILVQDDQLILLLLANQFTNLAI